MRQATPFWEPETCRLSAQWDGDVPAAEHGKAAGVPHVASRFKNKAASRQVALSVSAIDG